MSLIPILWAMAAARKMQSDYGSSPESYPTYEPSPRTGPGLLRRLLGGIGIGGTEPDGTPKKPKQRKPTKTEIAEYREALANMDIDVYLGALGDIGMSVSLDADQYRQLRKLHKPDEPDEITDARVTQYQDDQLSRKLRSPITGELGISPKEFVAEHSTSRTMAWYAYRETIPEDTSRHLDKDELRSAGTALLTGMHEALRDKAPTSETAGDGEVVRRYVFPFNNDGQEVYLDLGLSYAEKDLDTPTYTWCDITTMKSEDLKGYPLTNYFQASAGGEKDGRVHVYRSMHAWHEEDADPWVIKDTELAYGHALSMVAMVRIAASVDNLEEMFKADAVEPPRPELE